MWISLVSMVHRRASIFCFLWTDFNFFTYFVSHGLPMKVLHFSYYVNVYINFFFMNCLFCLFFPPLWLRKVYYYTIIRNWVTWQNHVHKILRGHPHSILWFWTKCKTVSLNLFILIIASWPRIPKFSEKVNVANIYINN